MDEAEFRKHLRRGGRSSSAVDRVIEIVQEYAAYLRGIDQDLDRTTPAVLETYVDWLETESKSNPKKYLWAIRYYYQYSNNIQMERYSSDLRQARIARKPFALRKFRGVNPAYIKILESVGIMDIVQMVEAGETPQSRQALADETGIPVEAILEYVKLSDLARIPGLKGIRARLYYEAGVDTVENLASWEPESLRLRLLDYVEQSGFDGIAPLPKETQHSVETARKLPRVVEYEQENSGE